MRLAYCFWSRRDDEWEDSKTDAGRYSSPRPSHSQWLSISFFLFLTAGQQQEDLIADNFHIGPKEIQEGRKKCTQLHSYVLFQGELWVKKYYKHWLLFILFRVKQKESLPVGAFIAATLSLRLLFSNPNIPLNHTYSTGKPCANVSVLLGTSETGGVRKAC